ncbi:PREDICTED: 28S ribosomal protein S11, mitochondrial-like [Priapulus caudatus]|uniref:28S ribosomal protein S11, mitochondrial-like n=1 Tax=Priapulus caudatus TaxID=37621 RepID=A0ABM1EDG0_PRICU|nr:PREDICTED: 28S ribosomal protein S11, mitochondrial-like [Priapulus caudatus]
MMLRNIIVRASLYTCSVLPSVLRRGIHCSAISYRRDDRKTLLQSVMPTDEGVEGEKSQNIEGMKYYGMMTPTLETFSTLFGGIRYDNLPVAHVKISQNNTIINVTDHLGVIYAIGSCGTEGFKNARKGTNIAGQATGIGVGTRAVKKGVKQVRVRIKGLGPGRMASIKGLQMAGLDIVSITDCTPIIGKEIRPRKQRKL